MAALTIVVGVVLATAAPAAAWFATPSGSFACAVTDTGFAVKLNFTVTSWAPGELQGQNPAVTVELSRDGGPFELIATGAFTAENGGVFGGSTVLPDGTSTVTLRTIGTGPWGDGTFDKSVRTADLAVPTLEAIGDPACLPQPTPTPEPTATPEPTPAPSETPQPTPEPTPEPTPTETPSVLPGRGTPTPAPPGVQPTPTAEVLPKVLARTGNESAPIAAVGLALISLGSLAYVVSRARA